ncbi:hypothetical protein BDZ97DRAFT_147115 [Flammula alnicola]|nr:hypothetical protein BDZ97DRAFT_147115 [Flammula alnicola]
MMRSRRRRGSMLLPRGEDIGIGRRERTRRRRRRVIWIRVWTCIRPCNIHDRWNSVDYDEVGCTCLESLPFSSLYYPGSTLLILALCFLSAKTKMRRRRLHGRLSTFNTQLISSIVSMVHHDQRHSSLFLPTPPRTAPACSLNLSTSASSIPTTSTTMTTRKTTCSRSRASGPGAGRLQASLPDRRCHQRHGTAA